jgi:hypothetical protein
MIMTSPVDFINQPSLVVIIDCWNVDNPHLAATARNIRNWVETDPNVAAIAVASYVGLDNRQIYQEEPGWSTGKDFFHDTCQWQTLRNIWEETEHMPGVNTHPVISGIKPRADQRMFVAWRDLQVLYYCNYINPSIRNIYVVGQAWDVCVKFRSVGWEKLKCLNTINFLNPAQQILSRKDCVLGVNFQPVDAIQPPWSTVTDNIIKLT